MNRFLQLVVLLAPLTGAVGSASAFAVADGNFDAGWAGGGRIAFPGNFTDTSANSRVGQLVVESNGNLLLAGIADSSNGIYWWLGELFANGQFVPTFGPSDGSGRTTSCQLGFACAAGIVEEPQAILAQPDGKYVVLSNDYVWRTTAHANALDLAGVTGGKGYVPNHYQINDVEGSFYSPTGMALQADGKILLVGQASYSAANTTVVFGILRLNADLSLDTSFDAMTDGEGVTFAGGAAIPVADGDVYELSSAILQSGGGIVLVGAGETATNSVSLEAVRLTPAGLLDAGFGSNGKVALAWSAGNIVASHVEALVDRAGRIAVVPALPGSGMLVARLTSAGSADATFGDSGFAFYDAPTLPCANTGASALAIDSAGRILVAGSCGDDSIGIERLRGDTGALDAAFGIGGFSHGFFAAGDTVSVANAIVQDQSGHPIIAGLTSASISAQEFAAVARLSYDLIYTNNLEEAPRGCLPPDCN